jgi:hypothetical protein
MGKALSGHSSKWFFQWPWLFTHAVVSWAWLVPGTPRSATVSKRYVPTMGEILRNIVVRLLRLRRMLDGTLVGGSVAPEEP